jgi:hypothetical protein
MFTTSRNSSKSRLYFATNEGVEVTDAGGEGAGREGGGCEGGEEPRECKPVTTEAVGGLAQARFEKNFPWLSMRLQLAGSTNRLCSSRSSPPRWGNLQQPGRKTTKNLPLESKVKKTLPQHAMRRPSGPKRRGPDAMEETSGGKC